ncbi:MAG: glycoside hydrolase family 18 protein [Clostridia bacterium]|nr:glycoside hydrolase family 18 protein [Clostridia bacterium]
MSVFSKIVSFLMSILLFLCGAAQGSVPEKAEKFRVVSYLVVFDDAAVDAVDPSHFRDLTDVIIFGGYAGMRGDGTVTVSDRLAGVVERLKALDESGTLRWHLNFDIVTDGDQKMTMREDFRGKELARSIRAVLEKYDLDGAFFDYEFPQEWDAKLDFSVFLINLKQCLGDDFRIGAALQPWCASFLPGAIAAIDMVELMCYDNWDDEGFHSSMALAKQDVKNMVKLGYKLNRIDLGLPFYARPTTKEARWYDYRQYWDKIDENGLAEEEGTGLIASFNTPGLIYEKTKWAIETGLSGVMIWHYACDVPADNDASLFNQITKAKSDALNGKIT